MCNLMFRRVRVICCHGKAVTVTYSECVFVALVIQHQSAYAVLHCHLPWLLWLYQSFPHYLINGTTSGKKYRT
jgi:hypothetical protein